MNRTARQIARRAGIALVGVTAALSMAACSGTANQHVPSAADSTKSAPSISADIAKGGTAATTSTAPAPTSNTAVGDYNADQVAAAERDATAAAVDAQNPTLAADLKVQSVNDRLDWFRADLNDEAQAWLADPNNKDAKTGQTMLELFVFDPKGDPGETFKSYQGVGLAEAPGVGKSAENLPQVHLRTKATMVTSNGTFTEMKTYELVMAPTDEAATKWVVARIASVTADPYIVGGN